MISVVIASHQGANFIGAQLDSIVYQITGDDEVIVSDDASSDRTVDIVRSRNDPRIKVIANSDNVGYVKNFERAIANAAGEHIFFSDQDDVWLPNKIAAVTSALGRKPCVATDAIVVDELLRETHHSYFEMRGASSFTLRAIFMKPCLIGATMACSRRYLDTLLPLPHDVPHDFWLSINAVWDGQLEVMSDALILYRRHRATASISATSLKRPLSLIVNERLKLASHFVARRVRRRFGPFTPIED